MNMQIRALTTLVALALGITLATTSPVLADDTPPPVVGADTVTLYPGQSTEIDVLENDSSPSGDDLALCRFPDDPSFGMHSVQALQSSFFGFGDVGSVVVSAMPKARGTHVIDYFVCDHTHLVPATLTVVVREVEPVDVTKLPHRAGRLQVTNHNSKPIRFWFGNPQGSRVDGQVRIAAGDTVPIKVQRHEIFWVGMIGGGRGKGSTLSGPGIADFGTVRHIKLNGAPLPDPHGPAWDEESSTDAAAVIARWR
jgi:hypothetical protein